MKISVAVFHRSVVILLVMLLALSCARRAEETAAAAIFSGTLRVTNNLREALDLRATGATGVLWTGRVAANSSVDGSVGSLPAGAVISLRATNAQGAVISARDSVIVRSEVLTWIIP